MFRQLGRSFAILVASSLLFGVIALCQAQDAAPAVDMRDPVAIVQAYTKACADRDVDAALALVTVEEGLLPGIKVMLRQMDPEAEMGGVDMRTILTEVSMLPSGGGEADVVVQQQPNEGEAAVVTRVPAVPAQTQFVLAKQEDGTWRIDLVKSITRTTGKPGSFFIEQARMAGALQEGGGGNEDWREQDMARRLVQALIDYAEANDNRLPAAETWMDDLEAFLLDPALLKPSDTKDKPSGWAINRAVAGQPLPQDWQERQGLVLILRTKNPERNAAEDAEEAIGAATDMNESLMVGLATGETISLPPGMTVPALMRAFEASETCQQRLRALCEGLRRYARANKGLLPPADSWCDDIALHMSPEMLSPETFKCPSRPQLECAWAINAALAGTDITKLERHDRYVLLLPAVMGVRNESRELPQTVEEGWHLQRWNPGGGFGVHVGMLDGNTRLLTAGDPYPQPADPGEQW